MLNIKLKFILDSIIIFKTKKGKSRIIKKTTLRFPFLSSDHMMFFLPRKNSQVTQAGLLTFGSIYLSRLPADFYSGIKRRSSPITAAGPSLNFTGFPVLLFKAPE